MQQGTDLSPVKHLLLLGLCLMIFGACVKQEPHSNPQHPSPLHKLSAKSTTTGIGPYPSFNGRLLVIQKAKRWQVMLSWRSTTPNQGWLRLHHAASSRIIEVKWYNHFLQTRDNNDQPPIWKEAGEDYLQQQGINIRPQDLTTFLLGDVPQGFTKKGNHEWRGHRGKSVLHVVWNPNRKSFMIMDMYQGSKILLYIL